ncbi:hypothetical protein ABES28_13240 [Bacillus licheniformis]|uniref:Phage protein n=1 Tax=Bacillus licheniformis TaxID=1402 RepID=A0AB37GKL2_BACLI|nr:MULTISPECIES: hypothetical protein [Bacillus]MDD0822672.1 hypothetical protein [Bacillus cereus]MED1082828.1 hypothetical protein [Bacillus licheniformis]QPR70546.1 hypothetical protein I6G80_00290 [Bacillus licheniformis]
MGLKNFLYSVLKISNDINAIKKGKVGKRIARRAVGKATGRAMNKWIGK